MVLPFENLSRQPGDEWLASAFSDSLTLGLRDAENLIVVSRERLLELNQSGRRSDAVDVSNVQQLSRLLNVRYYVTGTPDAATRFRAVIERGPLTLTEIDTARAYSQVGRIKDAVPHFERAFAADASCAVFVEECPAFAPYRGDPAFRALLDKYPRGRAR